MEKFQSKKVEGKEDFEKKHYKYVYRKKFTQKLDATEYENYKEGDPKIDEIEIEKFERFCLDREGRMITFQKGDNRCGVSSEDYFWRFDPDNYNADNSGLNPDNEECKVMLEKAQLKEIPKALPLPKEWRDLLPKDLKKETFFLKKIMTILNGYTHILVLCMKQLNTDNYHL
jgi:hypothetical protein